MILKKLLAFFVLCLSGMVLRAQIKPINYDAKWKTVDSLIYKKGLSETALAEINRIYLLARQDHNDAQGIKALVYRITLNSSRQEDATPEAIKELDSAISVAQQPARSILQCLLADVYWQYFQRHQWELGDRTNTMNFVKTNIASWGADDFNKNIDMLYRAALQNEDLLKATKLENYEPVIIKGNVRSLRPTLFDLLAHEALDFYKRNDRHINQPANVFELDDPAAFAGAAVFARHTFLTPDTSSLHYKGMLLFQRLIRQHLNDPRPGALIDVDIERVQFVYSYAVMDNKDSLYTKALAGITDRYGDEPAAAQAWFLQASQLFHSTAVSYRDSSGSANVTAKAICERVIAKKDSSEGKANCKDLLNQILQKWVSMQTERVSIPGKPIRARIEWSNFDHLYLRLLSLNSFKGLLPEMQIYDDNYWLKLAGLPLVRSFDQTLPGAADYRRHATEIAIGSLPPGVYALVGCNSPNWSKENVAAVQYLYVSSIAYVSSGRHYFVVNRETGEPLAGASVRVMRQEYDRNARGWQLVLESNYKTDDQGQFLLTHKAGQSYQSKMLDIQTATDRLFIRDASLNDYMDVEKLNAPAATQVFFFLDRKLYRPGQTLYFKGVAVTEDKDSHHPKVLADRRTKVILYDANNTPIDSLDVKANEYGSYHGAFRLPTGKMNGEFRIADTAGGNSQSFSVEEYKRPNFYVEYEKQKGSYRVGDSITVTGNVKAYAGNVLDGAVVKYRIVRRTRFVPYWHFRGNFVPRGNVQEIKHGEIKTDSKGLFRLVFSALPDRSMDRSTDPRFEYEVSADVTDVNGETRSGMTSITAGYTVLDLSIGIPGGEHQPADSLKRLTVKTTNLSGERVTLPVDLSIYPLQSPNRLIRERLWGKPDVFVLSEKEFLDSFPHDEYRDELAKESWAKGQKVWETKADSTSIILPSGRLAPGWYVIEARATDRYGQPVKDVQYVELFDGKTGRPANPQYNWSLTQEQTAEPGGTVRVETGSSAGDVFVIRKVSRADDKKEEKFSTFTLNKEKKSTELPITEADRGGMGISDVFVKDNRVYTHPITINVPWSNKQLSIHYTSYRDKTLPGSGEKWSVTIDGHNTDKVSAEVLSSMYDASLDQFAMHNWEIPALYPVFSESTPWISAGFGSASGQERPGDVLARFDYLKVYDQLMEEGKSQVVRKSMMNIMPLHMEAQPMASAISRTFKNAGDMSVQAEVMAKKGGAAAEDNESAPQPVQVRKNFNETAFFFPDLRTDSAGSVSFSFTMPEALTSWKWMTLAQTKELAFGYSEKTIITQKQLMVQPNVPRFLREGDHMDLAVKVVNLTDSEMTGQMVLQLTDPTTGQTADGWFTNRQPNQYFTVGAGQSAVVSFPLVVPFQYNRPLTYRVIAQARNYSDGEEATLPVVSNRMLVTETLPLNLSGNGTRSFTFDKLLHSGSSETLNHHALTVEFTTNPAWYAVQSLPYLTEYPYECAEQTFNRFYANALASKIASSSPRLQEVFARWRTQDTAALLSNLQKNQELKTVLLEETPWVLQGKTEAQQKKNIALLFDMSRMGKELDATLERLIAAQSATGGFAWFKGGYDDLYITQYILTGIGHLQKLQALPASLASKVAALVKAALPFVDGEMKRRYEEARKTEGSRVAGASAAGARAKTGAAGSGKIAGPGGVWIGELPVQYLYMRSYFSDYGIPGDIFPAMSYFRKKVQQTWVGQSKYMQGMIALALFRTGDVQTAKDIIKSLQQNAIRDEDRGMYWKGMEGGYYWYEAPIEIQSLLIEAFREISGDAVVDRDLKTWLLTQKQTHSWRTTKATADACYALLVGGQDWLNAEREVEVKLGEKVVSWGGAAGPGLSGEAAAGEAGTGYNKKVFDGAFVTPAMGNITVTMRAGAAAGGSPAWGAVYWQYFDILDRITPPGGSKAPLKLTKKLFIERNTDGGRVLDPVADNGVLKPGDKVVVRIELQADRSMEYVHMKDMRAACMEPVNVLSQYKWQGGLGYYESTKDASTDFFFASMPRGTYVFEYPLKVGQAGNFSNGITSIECMYAPEFAYHSEGIRVSVEGAP